MYCSKSFNAAMPKEVRAEDQRRLVISSPELRKNVYRQFESLRTMPKTIEAWARLIKILIVLSKFTCLPKKEQV